MPSVMTVVVFAALWGVAAIAWLLVMPADARAKGWHYVHALLPFVALGLYAVAPPLLREPLRIFLSAGLLVFLILAVTWAVGEACRNHGIMDVVYPIVPAAVSAFALSQAPVAPGAHAIVLAMLVAIWAARLVAHMVLTRGNLANEPEPYASLRRKFGARWTVWGFFSVYMLQGVLCWVWSAVLVFAFTAPDQHFAPLDGVAVALWLVGFVFQAGGDRQLARFKRDPANRGKLFQGGLWSLTRHPNYFGEAVMWWAYFLFALAHPWGFITIVSPLYATWFMASGSAAPGNERHMRKTRPDYEDYARRVPQFFPWRFAGGPGRTPEASR
jgi:steroid 5-alpha reductase family enzyme